MNISKALKTKNRIVEKISKIDAQIQKYNSVWEDVGRPVDINKLYRERLALTEKLIQLKTNIAKANFDIQEKIFRIAELKGIIILVSGLSTQKGPVENTGDYRSFRVRQEGDPLIIAYDATIDLEKQQTIVDKLQSELDDIQDDIERYNAAHEIPDID
jgi:peptidoglycan hydrolase CwlO-like protein